MGATALKNKTLYIKKNDMYFPNKVYLFAHEHFSGCCGVPEYSGDILCVLKHLLVPGCGCLVVVLIWCGCTIFTILIIVE